MRNSLVAAAIVACLGLSGCAVNTVWRCVDHPVACAGTVAAGAAGGYWLINNTDFGDYVPTP